MKRDFLSDIFSGNWWSYGHFTAATIQSMQITTPKLLDFEERVVHAEERSPHAAILLRVGADRDLGEAPIRRRIGEIEKQALNRRPRTVFRSAAPRVPCANTSTFPWRTCANFPARECIFISMSSAFRLSRFTSRIGPRKFPSLKPHDGKAPAVDRNVAER